MIRGSIVYIKMQVFEVVVCFPLSVLFNEHVERVVVGAVTVVVTEVDTGNPDSFGEIFYVLFQPASV